MTTPEPGLTLAQLRELPLGAPVNFNATLVRKQKLDEHWGADKFWQAEPCDPNTGILVGRRQVSDGKRVWEGEDEGYSYTPTRRYWAALVAVSTRHTPVLVPLEALQEAQITDLAFWQNEARSAVAECQRVEQERDAQFKINVSDRETYQKHIQETTRTQSRLYDERNQLVSECNRLRAIERAAQAYKAAVRDLNGQQAAEQALFTALEGV